MKKNLYIVRKEHKGFGGAENVAKRYAEGFCGEFTCKLIFAGTEIEGFKFGGSAEVLVGLKRSRLQVPLIVFSRKKKTF